MHQPLLKAFALFFLFTCFGYAQEYDVTGKLTDQNGEALSYVNILLLQAEDSTVVNGVTSMDDGGFIVEGVQAGSYILKSSYIGYQTDVRPLEVNANLDLGVIMLSPVTEDLQGVTVSFRKPTIEKKPDRLVFNVANTTLSALSGYEILKRTPGVIAMNNQLLVKNSRPAIYLNNKRVYLNNDELVSLLQGYSGSNVESVEVITNPPASYDAEGGVVLNIVTRSNVSIGYKGSLEGRGTYAVFPKYNFSTQHFYKTKDIDFFFNYNFNRSKLFKNDVSYINFTDEGFGTESWDTDFKRITRKNDHSVNSILDIATGESSSLTLSANLFWSPDKRFDNEARTDVTAPQSSDYYFDTESFVENDTYNYTFGAEYSIDLDETGSSLNTAANYIYYQQNQFQELGTVYYDNVGMPTNENAFDTDGQQKSNIFTLQADLLTSLGEDGFGAGVKYVNTKNKSGIAFTGTSVPGGAINDNFEYDESIYAAYLQYDRSWEKWEMQLGARAEYTDVLANSLTLGEVNTRKYFGLFPSFGLQYTPGENHSYGFSYGRKLNRPDYKSLNPFRYYIIEDQFREGNPNLTRATEDKISLSYTFKKTYTLEFGHQYVDGDLSLLPFQDNALRQLYQTEYNIDYFKQYNLDFAAPINLSSKWFAYVVLSGYYMENRFLARESGNVMVKNNTNGLIAMINNSFIFGKNGNTSLDMFYQYISDFISGSYKYKNLQTLNLSLRRNLWNERGVLVIGLDDVFNTYNIPMNSTYLNQDNGFFARPETRKFFVSFRYNFGNFRLHDNNRNTNPVELERLKESE